MTQDFCTDVKRGIRRLGYAPKAAALYAAYLNRIVVLIGAVMGKLTLSAQQVPSKLNAGSGGIFAAHQTSLLSAYYALRS